jgi:hypothetical protein
MPDLSPSFELLKKLGLVTPPPSGKAPTADQQKVIDSIVRQAQSHDPDWKKTARAGFGGLMGAARGTLGLDPSDFEGIAERIREGTATTEDKAEFYTNAAAQMIDTGAPLVKMGGMKALEAGLPLAAWLKGAKGEQKAVVHGAPRAFKNSKGELTGLIDFDKLSSNDLLGRMFHTTNKHDPGALSYANSYAFGAKNMEESPNIVALDPKTIKNVLDLQGPDYDTNDLAQAVQMLDPGHREQAIKNWRYNKHMSPTDRQEQLASQLRDIYTGLNASESSMKKMGGTFDAARVQDMGHETFPIHRDAEIKSLYGQAPMTEGTPLKVTRLPDDYKGNPDALPELTNLRRLPSQDLRAEPDYFKRGMTPPTTKSGFQNTTSGKAMQAKLDAKIQENIDKMSGKTPLMKKSSGVNDANYYNGKKLMLDGTNGKYTVSINNTTDMMELQNYLDSGKIPSIVGSAEPPAKGMFGAGTKITDVKPKSSFDIGDTIKYTNADGETYTASIAGPKTKEFFESKFDKGTHKLTHINDNPIPKEYTGLDFPDEQHFDYGPDFGHLTEKEANQFYSAGEMSATKYYGGLQKPIDKNAFTIKGQKYKVGDKLSVKWNEGADGNPGTYTYQPISDALHAKNINDDLMHGAGGEVTHVNGTPVTKEVKPKGYANWKIDSPFGKGLSVEDTFKKGNYGNVYGENGIDQFVDDLEHAETQSTTFKIDKGYKNTATKLKEAAAKLDPLQNKPYGDSKFTNKDYIDSAFEPGDSFGMTTPNGEYYNYKYNSHDQKADLEKLITSGHNFADYVPEGEKTSALGWQQHPTETTRKAESAYDPAYDAGKTPANEPIYNFNGEYLTESEATNAVKSGKITVNDFENKFGHTKPFDIQSEQKPYKAATPEDYDFTGHTIDTPYTKGNDFTEFAKNAGIEPKALSDMIKDYPEHWGGYTVNKPTNPTGWTPELEKFANSVESKPLAWDHPTEFTEPKPSLTDPPWYEGPTEPEPPMPWEVDTQHPSNAAYEIPKEDSSMSPEEWDAAYKDAQEQAAGQDPSKKLVGSELVKSGKSPHIYIPKDVEFVKNLGGIHDAQLWNYGGVPHVFKKEGYSGPLNSLGEEYGSKIANMFGGTPVAERVNIPGMGKGTLQKYIEGASTVNSLSDLSGLQRADLATQHPVDWMIGNHDTHIGNFVKNPGGIMVPVDKGQSFKHWQNEVLSPDYNPNAKFGVHDLVYPQLRDMMTSGKSHAVAQAHEIKDEGSKLMDYYKGYAQERYPGDYDMQNLFTDAQHKKLVNLPDDIAEYWDK